MRYSRHRWSALQIRSSELLCLHFLDVFPSSGDYWFYSFANQFISDYGVFSVFCPYFLGLHFLIFVWSNQFLRTESKQ